LTGVGIDEVDETGHLVDDADLPDATETVSDAGRKADQVVLTNGNDLHAVSVLKTIQT
jgi:FMN phosphatase YigB (HAD superfamily)